MDLLLVVSVVSLGLQATAARRIAADPAHVAQIEREILAVTYRARLRARCRAAPALTPLINALLRLDSLATAALVGDHRRAGHDHGRAGRHPPGRAAVGLRSALLYVAAGVPRLVIGTALIAVAARASCRRCSASPIGACAPVVVGWCALRRGAEPRRALSDDHARRPDPRESLHNSQALLAFFALSNVDIIVARNVLTAHDAGLYAGGLILTKAVLFLPQFVVVVAFPSMATAAERRRRPVARPGPGRRRSASRAPSGVTVLSDLAMVFVGGDEYAEIEPTSSGCSRCSARCWRCCSCWSTRCSPGRARASVYLVWVGVGRAGPVAVAHVEHRRRARARGDRRSTRVLLVP